MPGAESSLENPVRITDLGTGMRRKESVLAFEVFQVSDVGRRVPGRDPCCQSWLWRAVGNTLGKSFPFQSCNCLSWKMGLIRPAPGGSGGDEEGRAAEGPGRPGTFNKREAEF